MDHNAILITGFMKMTAITVPEPPPPDWYVPIIEPLCLEIDQRPTLANIQPFQVCRAVRYERRDVSVVSGYRWTYVRAGG